MNPITLKGYRAKSIEFVGNAAPGSKIQLENKYSYNVRYTPNQVCVAELTCHVFDKEHPEAFFAKVVLEGIFSFDEATSKEQIHVLSYKELFPFARAIISTVTSVGGMAPIIIPAADIEGQNIYRIDTGNIKP